MSDARIGVYVCHCGHNISKAVDCSRVVHEMSTLDGVEVVKEYKYMCSDPGQEMIRNDIKEKNLNRIVVAACSPRMHEATFRKTLEKAGLNGYLLDMTNIREHVSWVTENNQEATQKAIALTRGSVRRVKYQEAIEEREVGVQPAVLVVGAGIAGIQAALQVAEAGHQVYLVEKQSYIGGKMAKFDKTFPTLDCAACILTPKMVQVGQDPKIKLFTNSSVVSVDGYVGNFKVTIKEKPRYINHEKCTGCGDCATACIMKNRILHEFDEGLSKRGAVYIPFPQAVPLKAVIDDENCLFLTRKKCNFACVKACGRRAINFNQQPTEHIIDVGSIILATGFELFDAKAAPQYGYEVYPNVINGLQFERMTNASGPTGGRIVMEDGSEPKTVAVVHCVGSRDENYHKHCSRVCCMSSIKFAHMVKELSGAEVYEFYIDIRTFGKQYEEFYNRVQEEGVNLIRGKVGEVIQRDNKLIVKAEDTLLGEFREIPVDMVILNTALKPQSDVEKVAQVFGISRSADGFFLESHIKLDPVTTTTDGIYLAGCCQSPKDIPDTVAQGSAAASQSLAIIATGKVKVSPISAEVDENQCASCGVCIGLCPYRAIKLDAETKRAQINSAVCKGCGTCAAACPSGAIAVAHFNDEQLLAQIEGVLA